MQTPDAISESSDRLHLEADLLKAMYEDAVSFNPTTSEVLFKSPEQPTAQLVLRFPGSYPDKGRPLVVSACDSRKKDLRGEVAEFIKDLGDEEHEVLDVVFQRFTDLLEEQPPEVRINETRTAGIDTAFSPKTVIIWLHHLLATSKRKLALSPSTSSDVISGITKPGYPGVMLFTGPRHAVDEHVAELKGLNWQAFQIRYEEEEEWDLSSGKTGKGIVEVETMAEVVQQIHEGRREHFLKAIGVK